MKINHSACSCTQDIAREFTQYKQNHPDCVIYQTSLMSSLLSGVYEGFITMAQLLKQGDFGLGTFNELDGELIAFDRSIFQLRADGSARPARQDQKTPFAVMTFFKPTEERRFDHLMTKQQVHDVIDNTLATDNLFCALRIDGTFSHVETRTVPRQIRPYKPMLEAIRQQPTFGFEQQKGLVVGFRSPAYTQGINVAGYHEHFITEDRSGGGHMLDYQLEHGVLRFGAISRLLIDLPGKGDFLNADLLPSNLDSAIRSAEG